MTHIESWANIEDQDQLKPLELPSSGMPIACAITEEATALVDLLDRIYAHTKEHTRGHSAFPQEGGFAHDSSLAGSAHQMSLADLLSIRAKA